MRITRRAAQHLVGAAPLLGAGVRADARGAGFRDLEALNPPAAGRLRVGIHAAGVVSQVLPARSGRLLACIPARRNPTPGRP